MSNQSAVPALFLGARNAGKKTQSVVMAWALAPTQGSGNPLMPIPASFQVPPNATSADGPALWTPLLIDPIAQQGSFTFGTAKTMQLNVNRLKGVVVDGTEFVIPGRLLIYIETTGQVIVLGPKNYLTTDPYSEGVDGHVYDQETFIMPIFLSQSGKIQLWLEQDIATSPAGTGGTPHNGASSISGTIELMNYDVQPVSISE